MLKDRLKALLDAFVAFNFRDEVRLVELFSALNLLAWSNFFATTPDILARDSYAGFGGEEPIFWACCFGIIGAAQVVAMVIRWRHAIEVRFCAFAFAAGAWTVIAWNFWSTGVLTTANLNYSLLAGACAISGSWLAWKTTSYQS
ncbi:hypothetical protein [Cognatishimia sp. MH4019]|uniref:hypothetical protein n=1 Tax=Cognatishimia sp. MH4019 TaxID=2854030 RepID=UPI001CD5A62B|nr:hypothetical protein [Cognatishimia sp. MH4019]